PPSAPEPVSNDFPPHPPGSTRNESVRIDATDQAPRPGPPTPSIGTSSANPPYALSMPRASELPKRGSPVPPGDRGGPEEAGGRPREDGLRSSGAMLHHVYLSPGMFGFGRLASYDYFTHVERALTARLRAAGHEVATHVIHVSPTASIRRRALTLAE